MNLALKTTRIFFILLLFICGCVDDDLENGYQEGNQQVETVDIDSLYHDFLIETFGLKTDSLEWLIQPFSLENAKKTVIGDLSLVIYPLIDPNQRYCILFFDQKNQSFLIECNDIDFQSFGTSIGVKNHLLINSEKFKIPNRVKDFLQTETDSFYLVQGDNELDRMRIVEKFLDERFKYELVGDEELNKLMDTYFAGSNRVTSANELVEIFVKEYDQLMKRSNVNRKVKKLVLRHYQLRINEIIDVAFFRPRKWSFVYKTNNNMIIFIRVFYRDHNLDPVMYENLGKYSYTTQIKTINSLRNEIDLGYQAIE